MQEFQDSQTGVHVLQSCAIEERTPNVGSEHDDGNKCLLKIGETVEGLRKRNYFWNWAQILTVFKTSVKDDR